MLVSLKPRIRFEALKRDGFTCQYCGRKPPEVTLHVDHIVARVDGGTDDLGNLVTSCAACNLGKGVTTLVAVSPCVMCGAESAGNVHAVPHRLGTFSRHVIYKTERGEVTFDEDMGFVCNDCTRHAIWQLGCLIRPGYHHCAACGDQWASEKPIRLDPDDIVAGSEAWVCPTCAATTGMNYSGPPGLHRRVIQVREDVWA